MTGPEAGDGRMGSGRGGIGVSWLDVKLGLRMLLRHPGLTLVAVIVRSWRRGVR